MLNYGRVNLLLYQSLRLGHVSLEGSIRVHNLGFLYSHLLRQSCGLCCSIFPSRRNSILVLHQLADNRFGLHIGHSLKLQLLHHFSLDFLRDLLSQLSHVYLFVECARCCFNLLGLRLLLSFSKGSLSLLLDFLLLNFSSCLDHRCKESLLVKSNQLSATQAAEGLSQIVGTLTKSVCVDGSLTDGLSGSLKRCSGTLLERSTRGLLNEVLVLFDNGLSLHLLLLYLNLRVHSSLLNRLRLELYHLLLLHWLLLGFGQDLRDLRLRDLYLLSLGNLHSLGYLLLLCFCLLD